MTLLAWTLPHDRVGARSPFLNSCLRYEGSSDPTNFLGGWKPKKWGRSRPFWCFFYGDFRFHCVSISYASKKLLAPQGEELGEDEAEESNSYSLHLLRPDSRWALRHNTSDLCLSCTVHHSHTSKRPGKRKNSETNLDQHGCVLGHLAMSRLRLHRLRFGNTRHTNGRPLLHCRFESLAVVLQLSLDFRTLFRLPRRQIAGCAGAGYLPRPWHRICEPVRIPRYSYAAGQDGFHRPGCCG